MEISLKNINLLYKMAFLLGFKNSPGAAIFFFLINQSKIIFFVKWAYFGCAVL